MISINTGDHFLLNEAVKKTVSQNRLTETVDNKVTASVNTLIYKSLPRLIDQSQ
jgi:hypothetical protein